MHKLTFVASGEFAYYDKACSTVLLDRAIDAREVC